VGLCAPQSFKMECMNIIPLQLNLIDRNHAAVGE